MSTALTPRFRVSYPSVFKPKKNDLNGKEEYSVLALHELGPDLNLIRGIIMGTHTNLAEQEAFGAKYPAWTRLMILVINAAQAKFTADKSKWPPNMKLPFRDQKERGKIVDGKFVMPDAHVEGAIFMNLRSTNKPGLVDGRNGNQDIIDSAKFYAGCYAIANVSAYAYDQKGNRGVSLGLQGLQKTDEGDPLSGRQSPQDAFTPIEGAAVQGKSASNLFG